MSTDTITQRPTYIALVEALRNEFNDLQREALWIQMRKHRYNVSSLSADAGVQLGRYDERILTWICNYEPAAVQVFIGLTGRAYDSGLRDGGA